MWNYRVMRRFSGESVWYEIHEVYYDSSGNPIAHTETASKPYGESLEELAADLQHFAEALEKPPLDYDRIGNKARKEPE